MLIVFLRNNSKQALSEKCMYLPYTCVLNIRHCVDLTLHSAVTKVMHVDGYYTDDVTRVYDRKFVRMCMRVRFHKTTTGRNNIV